MCFKSLQRWGLHPRGTLSQRQKNQDFMVPSNPNYSTFLWNKTPACLPRVPINLHAITYAAHKLTLHKFGAGRKENKPNKTCLGNSPLCWIKFISWKYVNNSLLHLIFSSSHPFSILKESKPDSPRCLTPTFGEAEEGFHTGNANTKQIAFCSTFPVNSPRHFPAYVNVK